MLRNSKVFIGKKLLLASATAIPRGCDARDRPPNPCAVDEKIVRQTSQAPIVPLCEIRSTAKRTFLRRDFDTAVRSKVFLALFSTLLPSALSQSPTRPNEDSVTLIIKVRAVVDELEIGNRKVDSTPIPAARLWRVRSAYCALKNGRIGLCEKRRPARECWLSD